MEREHPDSGRKHPVIHNNLALRQQRDFSTADLAHGVNIGFFGDSFTENVRMEAPYMFQEVLDYLLNVRLDNPVRFNVLNFGGDGYGTDQCYLYYLRRNIRFWDRSVGRSFLFPKKSERMRPFSTGV